MLDKVLQLLRVSCQHKHISKPFPVEMAAASTSSSQDWEPVQSAHAGHYVVCLDCGRQFSYDWSEMKIIKRH